MLPNLSGLSVVQSERSEPTGPKVNPKKDQKQAVPNPYVRPARPYPGANDAPGAKGKGKKPEEPYSRPLVYDPTVPARVIEANKPDEDRPYGNVLVIAKQLLQNIPDAPPTEAAPHGIEDADFPMLERMIQLLGDKKVFQMASYFMASLQQQIFVYNNRENPIVNEMKMLLVGTFSIGATKVPDVFELLVCLYRAADIFRNHGLGDKKEALRFRTWWGSGETTEPSTIEYGYFHKLSAFLYVNNFRWQLVAALENLKTKGLSTVTYNTQPAIDRIVESLNRPATDKAWLTSGL